MMANVSDCRELHDQMWKLSDIDELFELFAQVLIPDDEINVPEQDDMLSARKIQWGQFDPSYYGVSAFHGLVSINYNFCD